MSTTGPVPEAPPAPPPAAHAVEVKAAKPIDAAKRQAAARKQAVRRHVAKLQAAKDVEELEQLMREQLHEAPGARPAAAPASATTTTTTTVTVDPKVALAEGRAAADRILGQVNAKVLKGTRFELDADGRQILAESAAPVMLKYGAKLESPEGMLLAAVVIVWGRPLWDVLVEGADPMTKEPPPAKTVAVVVAPVPAEGRPTA